jgi:hypothetical protein
MVVGFQVLTAVAMKISVFWDITPCSTWKVSQLLGGAFCLHPLGRGETGIDKYK